MQSVQLRMRCQRLDGHDFQCDFLDNHQLDVIYIITLSGNFTTTEIMRFMLLPNAKALEIEDVALLRAPRLASPYTTLTLKLTSLSLVGGENWNAAPGVISKILSICPRLQELHCQVPIVTTSQNGRTVRWLSVSKSASPVAFDLVFLPFRTTLRKHTICLMTGHIWRSVRFPQLDRIRDHVLLSSTTRTAVRGKEHAL
jgi:hypothetical protein